MVINNQDGLSSVHGLARSEWGNSAWKKKGCIPYRGNREETYVEITWRLLALCMISNNLRIGLQLRVGKQ